MTLVERLKQRPAMLAIAAGLLLSACAPAAHTDGVSGGGSDTMLRIGDAARDAGDISAAIPIYRRAHMLAPLELDPLLRLAHTLSNVGAHREAGNAWKRALTIEPRSFDARLGYGETLAALDQPTLALEQFRLAAELGSGADLYNGMGVAHDLLGEAAAAQAAYRKGLDGERSLKLLNNLGLSLALSGEFDEAIPVLEEANGFPGAGARHRTNLALAYALSGQADRSRAIMAMDTDVISAQRAEAFYTMLASLPDHESRVAAVGTYSAVRGNGTRSTENPRRTR
jgi:Flp pilus assembly protein TadD